MAPIAPKSSIGPGRSEPRRTGRTVTAAGRDNGSLARTGAPFGRGRRAEATMSDANRTTERERSAEPQPTRLARIAQRAHEIYVARGGQQGKAMDDWLQAEREIDAEIDIEQNRNPA
jgi:hypothetical protein